MNDDLCRRQDSSSCVADVVREKYAVMLPSVWHDGIFIQFVAAQADTLYMAASASLAVSALLCIFYLLWTWYNKDTCWISSLEKFFLIYECLPQRQFNELFALWM